MNNGTIEQSIIMNHSEFTQRFRQVASLHVDIQHTEAKPHFARIVLTRDPFLNSTGKIEEFINKSRDQLKSPMMLISSYTSEYADNEGDNIAKILTARMIILKDAKLGDYEAEEQAFNDTEQIGEECLVWINEFLEENPHEGKLLWSHSGNEKLSGITDRNLTGTGFTISLIDNNNPNLTFNPDKFLS